MEKQNESEKDLCLLIQGVKSDKGNIYYHIIEYLEKWL